MPLKMKQFPESERPYEKLIMYGEKKLSNAELLAIIIKTGNKEESSVDLARRVLLLTNDLKDLQNVGIEELGRIKGIGKVKSLQIKAVCELAKRMNHPVQKINRIVNSTEDVANLFIDELKLEKSEILKIVMLNIKRQIIKVLDLKIGTNKEILITPSQILSEVVKENIPKFILIHNHPSGDCKPSKEDKDFTKRLIICSKLLGVCLLDHIIIGNENYQSIFYGEESIK